MSSLPRLTERPEKLRRLPLLLPWFNSRPSSKPSVSIGYINIHESRHRVEGRPSMLSTMVLARKWSWIIRVD